MSPYDSKENRQKNKKQTGLERPKITEKEGNEVQVASIELHYQVKYFYLQPNHRLRVSCHLDLRFLPTLTQDSDRPDQSSFALHFPSKLFSLFCQPGPFDMIRMISTLFLMLYLKYWTCPWFFAFYLPWYIPWFSLLLPSIFDWHL